MMWRVIDLVLEWVFVLAAIVSAVHWLTSLAG